jgi:hypothetical protein
VRNYRTVQFIQNYALARTAEGLNFQQHPYKFWVLPPTCMGASLPGTCLSLMLTSSARHYSTPPYLLAWQLSTGTALPFTGRAACSFHIGTLNQEWESSCLRSLISRWYVVPKCKHDCQPCNTGRVRIPGSGHNAVWCAEYQLTHRVTLCCGNLKSYRT